MKNGVIKSLWMRTETIQAINQIAIHQERSFSSVVDRLLKTSLGISRNATQTHHAMRSEEKS